jgi:hypothetical protein
MMRKAIACSLSDDIRVMGNCPNMSEIVYGVRSIMCSVP